MNRLTEATFKLLQSLFTSYPLSYPQFRIVVNNLLYLFTQCALFRLFK